MFFDPHPFFSECLHPNDFKPIIPRDTAHKAYFNRPKCPKAEVQIDFK